MLHASLPFANLLLLLGGCVALGGWVGGFRGLEQKRGLLEMMNYSRSEPDWARVAGAAARIRIRQNMRCGLNHCLGKCRGGGPAKTAARLALSALSGSAFLLSLNLSWTLVENVGAQALAGLQEALLLRTLSLDLSNR